MDTNQTDQPVVDTIETEPTLEEEVGEEIAEVKEEENWKEKYIRALADYQNLSKRSAEEKIVIRTFASQIVIEKLLPVVDSLEKAEAHVKDTGLTLALKELFKVLEQFGVKKIVSLGQPFDPYTMECISVEEGTEDEVIEELIPGYEMNDKVIRPAKVKVGKKSIK